MTAHAMPQQHDAEFTQALMHQLMLQTAGAPGADFRVLVFYATAVPLGQTVRVVGKSIAEELKLSEPTVSKSIRRLAGEGWLELVYRQGPINFYRIGPRVMQAASAADGDEDVDDDLATVHHLSFGQQDATE
ncbi:winged helix-turn-helix domain-containing protein [Kitasatospora cineracea]|uniref:winged helix-turn-helix domain-containing protein n=1 Tax=Kitasatospora cineracea TaxID=88074 RepID=UPI003787BB7E